MLCNDAVSNFGLWYIIFFLACAFLIPTIKCIVEIYYIIKRSRNNIKVTSVPKNPNEEEINKLLYIYDKLERNDSNIEVLTSEELFTLRKHNII